MYFAIFCSTLSDAPSNSNLNHAIYLVFLSRITKSTDNNSNFSSFFIYKHMVRQIFKYFLLFHTYQHCSTILFFTNIKRESKNRVMLLMMIDQSIFSILIQTRSIMSCLLCRESVYQVAARTHQNQLSTCQIDTFYQRTHTNI